MIGRPAVEVIARNLVPDFGMIHLNGWSWPPEDEATQQFADHVLRDPRQVFFGPWFIRLHTVASRPVLILEWWPKPPPDDGSRDAPNGEAFASAVSGELAVPDQLVNAFTTTHGGGPSAVQIHTPRTAVVHVRVSVTDQTNVVSTERMLIRAGESRPTDVEFWRVELWPATR